MSPLPAWIYPNAGPRIEEAHEIGTLRFALRWPILPVSWRLVEDYGPIAVRWHRPAYREWDRNVTVYAWPGLHWLLRAYQWCESHRWDAERLGIRWGFYDLEEGGYFKDGRWTPNLRRVWEARFVKALAVRTETLDREYRRGKRDGEEAERARILAALDAMVAASSLQGAVSGSPSVSEGTTRP